MASVACYREGRRFPALAYESWYLCWKQDRWRVLHATEKHCAQFHNDMSIPHSQLGRGGPRVQTKRLATCESPSHPAVASNPAVQCGLGDKHGQSKSQRCVESASGATSSREIRMLLMPSWSEPGDLARAATRLASSKTARIWPT